MTVTGPEQPLAVGLALRDAFVLLLRHWILLLISMVVLAEGLLLGLYFLNKCLLDPLGWCQAGVLETLFGLRDGPAWAGSVALAHVVSFVVLVAALYFFFSSRGLGMSDRLYVRGSTRRASLFMGRAALFWIMVEVSVWFADFVASRFRDGLPVLSMAPELRWTLFGAHAIFIVGVAAYLHAKLAFYLPSAAFQGTPDSLGIGWRRTRPLMPRLFVAFLIFEIAAAAVQLGLLFLFYRVPAMLGLAEDVAWLLGTRSNFMLYALPPAGVAVFIGVPQTLLDAALSVVVFRNVVQPELQATAEVFS